MGSGNEGAASGHVSGYLQAAGNREAQIELSVAAYETGVSVQLWKEYSDRFQIRLRTPLSLIHICADPSPHECGL